jgi:zinc protease
VSKVSLPSALDFWQARVRNASNFTLVLVGDFSLEGIRPLVQLYFASLPAGHREISRTVAATSPPAAVERSFQRGTLPKARTQVVFEGTLELTPAREVTLRALRDLLELMLESQLRETIGGIYDVEVELTLRPTQTASYTMSVDFGAAPERIDDLAATVLNEVQRLCVKGPTDAEVSKVRAAAIRDAESDAVSNAYWASELEWRAQLGWTLESPSAHHALVSELSVEGFRQACYRYLDPTRYLRVTMRPRNGAVTIDAGLGTGPR